MRVLLFLAALLAAAVAADPPRALHVGLHAAWAPTGAAGEAAAWIATTAGNPTAWAFLDALAADASPAQPAHAAAAHARVTAAAAATLPARALPALQWALAARAMSPRVAAHQQSGAALLALFPAAAASAANASDAFAVRVDAAHRSAALLLAPGADPAAEIGGDAALQALAKLSPADHVLGATCAPSGTVLVFADAAASAFAQWHAHYASRAADCAARYVLRHWRAPRIYHAPVALQGYAVDIAVKSTEYRVVDDRVFTHRLFPDAPHGGGAAHSLAPAAADGAVDLDAFEAPFVGLAAAEHVRAAARDGGVPAAVAALRAVAEDAPVELRAVAQRAHVEQAAVRAAGALADAVHTSFGHAEMLFVNGRPLPVAQAVAQSLPSTLRCLAAAAHAAAALEATGAPKAEVAKVLHRGAEDADAIELRVELFGEGREDVVTWYNDLTKDSRYREWDAFENSTEGFGRYAEQVGSRGDAKHSRDFQALVKVRANLLSLVIALDPGDPRQMGFLSLPEQIVRGELPLRAGVVLVPNDEVSTMVTAGFHYFRLGGGKKAAVSFISTMQAILQYMGGGYQNAALSPQLVELAFQQVAGDQGGTKEYPSVASVVQRHEEVKGLLKTAREWARAKGLFIGEAEATTEKGEDGTTQNETDDALAGGRSFSMVSTINGILLKDVIADALPIAVKEQKRIARILKEESAEDETGRHASWDPTDWSRHDPSLIIVKRFSKSLLPQEPTNILAGASSAAERLSLAQLQQYKQEWSELEYIWPAAFGEETQALERTGATTLWLASCRHSSDAYSKAKELLKEFVKRPFVRRSKLRIGFLPESSQLSKEITKCISDKERESDTRYAINGRVLMASDIGSAEDLEAEVAAEYLSKASKFARRIVEHSNAWDAALFASAAIKDVDDGCSSSSSSGDDTTRGDGLDTVLRLVGDADPVSYSFPSVDDIMQATQTHPLTVIAVSDPLGAFSAATTAFLTAVSEAYSKDEVFTGLLLVPSTGVREEVPKSQRIFTRFLLAPKPEFAPDSGRLVPPRVSFARLPQKSILTVDVKQPRPWFIASFATNYDMDNVILSDLPADVPALYAQYVLKSLLVEGSCIDERGHPPQGLQLEMSRRGIQAVDTLVMGNLGYFQLRVPLPGQWGLSLAAGRSSNIFDIKSVDSRLSAMYGAAGAAAHTFSADTTGGIEVFVDSLNGACGTLLRVARKPGKEGERVLNPKGGMGAGNAELGRAKKAIRKVSSLVTGILEKVANANARKDSSDKQAQEKIHVFSVASGHLYERFLKIMMLSVTKHATRPVKFWLLENYLSPSFKKMLPHFAKMHGFEVGMVTYRWPGWLREQSEKQRIIWAYKILYLDVLFPLNVKRIIFVDSDQVVRSDLSELMDIDLQGAPYGYVPFCDSRKEVEGYRFWKTGFWESTLRGAKYHISALYVVDLQQLRETASGDKLRAMYDSLSADPNSLSNLDQDLPNYAAAVPGSSGGNVPIFGLPQDWLWCESWCDDESKKTAKTIDLCNNPMTKEPKLVSAKRIIGEWTSLDDEAGNATEKIYAMLVNGHGHANDDGRAADGTTEGTAGDGENVKDEL